MKEGLEGKRKGSKEGVGEKREARDGRREG